MDTRNNPAGSSLLQGMKASEGAASRTKDKDTPESGLEADDAALDSAAGEKPEAAEEGVRMEKVMAIQAALADGSYSVPASEVASKIVDAMLGGKPDKQTER